jgi:hypothetical protein
MYLNQKFRRAYKEIIQSSYKANTWSIQSLMGAQLEHRTELCKELRQALDRDQTRQNLIGA